MRALQQAFQRIYSRLSASHQADEVLRLGRHAIERWVATSAGEGKRPANMGLSLQASAELPVEVWSPPSSPTSWPIGVLTDALAQLYPSTPQRSIEVLLESTWLPVMLVPTGGALVSQAQAEALLRHRLAQLYDSPSDPVAVWDVRVDFSPGAALALGYGLSPQVSSALSQAASRLGLKLTHLTPAWAWGWQRAHAEGCFDAEGGWWGWQEQDRLLLGRVEGRGSAAQLKSLHPALACNDEPRHLAQTLQAEAYRLGLVHVPENLFVGKWTPQGCRFIKHAIKHSFKIAP